MIFLFMKGIDGEISLNWFFFLLDVKKDLNVWIIFNANHKKIMSNLNNLRIKITLNT